MIKEYIGNLNQDAWKTTPNPIPGKPPTRHQRLLEGGDDDPEAGISTRESSGAPPHLHPAARRNTRHLSFLP